MNKPINSHEIIIDALPDFIQSDNMHQIRGARYATEYLAENSRPSGEVLALHDNVAYFARNAEIDHKIETQMGTVPSTPLDKLTRFASKAFFTQYARNRDISRALFSLAEYKITHDRRITQDGAALAFSRALDCVDPLNRYRTMHNLLIPYFKRVSVENEVFPASKNQIMGGLAAYQVYLENSLDPSERMANKVVYRRNLVKAAKSHNLSVTI